MKYNITRPLVLEGLASARNQSLTLTELNGRGYRIIGGNRGELMFDGYELDDEANTTTLIGPVLSTSLSGLTEDEAFAIAEEVLSESFESIGFETVEC